MIHTRTINGVEVTAYDYSPNDDQWEKFIAYVYERIPPEIWQRVLSVNAFADYTEHGIAFNISCSLLFNAGRHVTEAEINALKPEVHHED